MESIVSVIASRKESGNYNTTKGIAYGRGVNVCCEVLMHWEIMMESGGE